MNTTRPLDERSPGPIQDYLLSCSLQYTEEMMAQGRPPVAWLLTFPSGRRLSSLDGPWSQHAQNMILDDDESGGGGGIPYSVPVIRQVAERLEIFYAGRLITMRPPEPVQFFSFARMAAPAGRVLLCNGDEEKEEEEEDTPPPSLLSPSPLWLYSVFGYCLHEYRVTLLLSEMQTSTEVAPRHDLLTLP